MAFLYELEIQSYSNGEECQRYCIGYFRSQKDAQKVAKRYLKEVRGFRDYYCEYSIREHELVGEFIAGFVHTYVGWNVDEDGNEYDIVEGLLYAKAEAAEAAMDSVQDSFERQEWKLQRWQVGKCEWAEGFVREYPDGRIAPTLPELREKLQSLADDRQHCGIVFEYDEDIHNGFPAAVGDQLFLMAVDEVFHLNGFSVRRLRDIHEVRQRKGLYQSITEREGVNQFAVPDVELDNWHSVFISIQWLDKPVIIQREYEPQFFRLGRIEQVKRDRVIMRYFNSEGVWQDSVEIPFQGITSVTFGDRYSELFSKYV